MTNLKRFLTPGWHIVLVVLVALTACLLALAPLSVCINGIYDALHGGAVFVMQERIAGWFIMIVLTAINFVSLACLEGRTWNAVLSGVTLSVMPILLAVIMPIFLFLRRTSLILDAASAIACAAAGINVIAVSIYFLFDRWYAFDAEDLFDDDPKEDFFDEDEQDVEQIEQGLSALLKPLFFPNGSEEKEDKIDEKNLTATKEELKKWKRQYLIPTKCTPL